LSQAAIVISFTMDALVAAGYEGWGPSPTHWSKPTHIGIARVVNSGRFVIGHEHSPSSAEDDNESTNGCK